MESTISIRPLTLLSEFKSVIAVQQSAWGMDDLTVVPEHLLHVVSKTGGVVLGAYSSTAELVGVTLGLLSRDQSGAAPYLTSHMMGVLPSWQSHNVGFQLKLAQAAWAREHDFKEIRWTYDPMETRNAALNIRKLGARVVDFLPNYYGSGLATAHQAGLPSDRFLVSWDVTSDTRENSPRNGVSLISVIEGEPHLVEEALASDLESALLSVPLDFQKLKAHDFKLARRWQDAIRQAASMLLPKGYWISGFHADALQELGHYVVTKREQKG
jgi:predicted GNAT superfamily acetyltransferase